MNAPTSFLYTYILLFQIPCLPLAWYKFSFSWQDASGILVHPSGAELPLCGAITGMRNYYGDKQGQQFRVWVDRVLSTQTGLDTWLVKFNKWELSGKTDFLVLMIALTIKLMIRCPLSLSLSRTFYDIFLCQWDSSALSSFLWPHLFKFLLLCPITWFLSFNPYFCCNWFTEWPWTDQGSLCNWFLFHFFLLDQHMPSHGCCKQDEPLELDLFVGEWQIHLKLLICFILTR